MERTGLMITSLLLYLKFFHTAKESIDYYNKKRCVDGKGLFLPSQIVKIVKYFERVLTYFNGEDQPGRRYMLRGIRLHRCPYWIRPSIIVSYHNGMLELAILDILLFDDYSGLSFYAGVLFSTKKHPRTKDLSTTPPSTIQMIGENKTAPKLQSKRKNVYISRDTMQKQARMKSQKSLNY
nr:phosphatidylinositol 3,4,5-trisphosphate 3-phosphatase and protein-tyrosine-phosphatase PTEN2A [Tanacetum cinerariifolium]